MLNNEKVVLMTKLAIYEQGEGKKTIPVSKYYKGDYIGMRLLSSFIYANVAFVIGFALWFCMNGTRFLEDMTNFGMVKVIQPVVIVYVSFTVVYLIVSYIFYTYTFKSTRRSLKKYNKRLEQLHKVQERELEAISESEIELEMGGEEE